MKKDYKILVIDNYDSFTYNLVHGIQELIDQEIEVVRNDEVDLDNIGSYEYLILSPGPGIPNEAGMLKEIISKCYKTHKILGICLGQQAIAEVFGGSLTNLEKVFHGVSTEMEVLDESSPIFHDIPNKFEAGRYHSWVVNPDTLPTELKIICKDATGEIMGVQHESYPIYALQFHPESILTPLGSDLLKNFLEHC